MVGHIPVDPKIVRELIAALKECKDAISAELSHMSEEEIKEDPTMQRRVRTVRRADRVLAKVKKL